LSTSAYDMMAMAEN